MTKDEIKNRISMALKDTVLQQGFEIICKENAELKKEVEKHKWNDIFLEESAYYDKKIAEEYTTLQERIKRLEKENKELKTKKIPQLERKIASIRGAHSVDCKKLNARTEQVERLKEVNAELIGQHIKDVQNLIKAKEIIKGFLNADSELDMFNAQYKAEQFLNSEVSE